MKWTFSQILFVLTLISIITECLCERDQIKSRLSRVFEQIIKKSNETYENELDNEIGRALNIDCVRNFLHLPQNNKMIVTQIEEMIFMIASGMFCSDEDKVFETQFEKYIHEGIERRASCVRYYLQELEPTSKLVEGFTLTDAEISECKKKLPTDKIVELQHQMESILGPLNVFSCGAVSENGANDFVKFLGKGAAIRFGDISDELKKSEKEKLKNYFKDISGVTANCMLKRYEDDPAGYHANDTLNFYYKKDVKSASTEEEDDPNEYYKKLAKVEGTFNVDCVKEKLNLPEFGDKSLLEVEATILIASAKSKCIQTNPLEFSNLFIDFALEAGQSSPRFFSCAKYALQKLEPTSKLAVTTSSDEIHEKYCRHYTMSLHPYSIPEWNYKDVVGLLDQNSCGVLTHSIVQEITLKTILLGDEKDKELKIKETKDLFKFATDKLHKFADCILERIK